MDFQRKNRTVAFGEYIFDQDNGELFSEGNRQVLMPKDGSVLCCLLKQPLRIVPKDLIFRDVWSDAMVSEGVLKACIRRIRQALGDDYRNPTYIETVKGRGYRLLCEVVDTETTFSGSQGAQQREAPRAGSTVEPGTSQPFVGRTAELHLMDEKFQLSRAGAAQILFLSGTAGMGKTALADRFVDSVRSHDTCLILRGACMEIAEMGEACLPILAALYELKNHLPHHKLKELLYECAPMWLLQFPWLIDKQERSTLLSELQGVSTGRMLRELHVLLEKLTSKVPTLIVLEDLHWADTQTLSAIEYLAKNVHKEHLLLIGTFRPGMNSDLTPLHLDLALKNHCSAISLSPLGEEEIIQLLAQQGAEKNRLAALATWIHRNTEGLPLFVINLYSYTLYKGWLEDDHEIDLQETEYETAGRFIPSTLKELILCQIEQLPEKEQFLLEFASIFGMTFNIRCLGGERDDSVLALEHYVEKLTNGYGFLQRSGMNNSADHYQGSEYSFTHSWFQKVVYERIPPVRRNHFHRQAGQRLESLFKHDIEGVAPALALHFEKAGDLPKAIHYRNIAGQAALQLFSADKVVRHLSRGLQLLASLPEDSKRADQEIEMLVPLGSVLVATRGYAHPEVESVYERAHKLCRKTEHNAQLLPTLYGLSTYYMVRGNFVVCRELYDLFLETAERDKNLSALAWGYSTGCLANWYQGRYRKCCDLAEKGLKFYDPSSQQEYCRLYGMDAGLASLLHSSLAFWIMGYPSSARNRMKQALNIAEQYSGPLMHSFVLCFAGWLELFFKDYDKSDQFVTRSLTLAAQHGIEYWNIQASFLQEYISGMTGRKADVTQLLNGYIETHRQTGAVLIRGMFLYLLAECYLQRNDPASALESVELALEATKETGEDWWKSELLRFKGDLLLKLAPRHGEQTRERAYKAENLYLKAAALANEQSAKTLELRATTSLYRLRAKTSREESARQRLGKVMAAFTEGFDTPDYRLAQSLLESGR